MVFEDDRILVIVNIKFKKTADTKLIDEIEDIIKDILVVNIVFKQVNINSQYVDDDDRDIGNYLIFDTNNGNYELMFSSFVFEYDDEESVKEEIKEVFKEYRDIISDGIVSSFSLIEYEDPLIFDDRHD